MEAILTGLLSPDNSVRQQAEATYNQAVATSFQQVALTLTHCIANDVDAGRRAMACVMLRRLFTSKDSWTRLDAASQNAIKDGLLASLATAGSIPSVTNKLCHTVAEVALLAAGPGGAQWPALLPRVFDLARSGDAPTRVIAVTLFGKLSEYAGDALLSPHGPTLQALLPPLLQDADNRVRTASLGAIIALLAAIEDDAVRAPFQSLVPGMMKVLELALADDEGLARESLESLIELVESHPLFLRPFVAPCCEAMLAILRHSDFEEETRALGLEFLLKLAEEAPATVRKVPGVVKAVIEASLHFLAASITEEPGWEAAEDNARSFMGETEGADEGDDRLKLAAASGLDRVSRAIGGKTVWPLFHASVAPMMASPDWRQRCAGLLALSLIGEGCRKVLAPGIRDIVLSVLPFMSDAHPRVRHAAIRATGQLVVDFQDPTAVGEGREVGERVEVRAGAGEAATSAAARAREGGRGAVKSISEAAGDIILPALVEAAGEKNRAVPRLRGLAVASLVNLFDPEFTDSSLLDKPGVLDTTLQTLFSVLRDVQQVNPREMAMTAIGAVAQVSRDGFERYYDVFMPLAKTVLAAASADKALSSLRNKALETLSLICEAVGREKSGMDAAEVMNTLVRAQINGLEGDSDGMGYHYVMSSIARLANCLGADFAPYLPFVMPRLLASAGRDVDVTVTDADVPDGAEGGADGVHSFTVEMSGVGNRRVALDESALNEKNVAMETLAHLIDDLGVDVPAFRAYVDQAAKVLAESLESPFAAVREFAAGGLRGILLSALADVSDLSHAQRVLEALLPPVLAKMAKEHDEEVRPLLGEAVSELFRVCYESTSDGAAVDVAIVAPKVGAGGVEHEGPTPHTRAIVPLASLPSILKSLQAVMQGCYERREAAKKQHAKNPDADEEEVMRFETQMEGEDELLMNMVDSVGYIIKQHKDAAMGPVGATVAPFLLKWLPEKSELNASLRAAAVCLCDDLLEFAGPRAQTLLPQFVPSMLESMTAKATLLRQCAVYGAGVCAEHGGPGFDQYLGPVLQTLGAVIQAPGSRKNENECPTDNAVSSVIKIAKFRAASLPIPVDSLMTMVLSYLPLKGDGIEARLVHKWMVDAVETKDPLWIGANGSRLQPFAVALAKALAQHALNVQDVDNDDNDEDEEEAEEEELFDEISAAKLVAIVSEGKGQVCDAVRSAMKSLSKKELAALTAFASSE